MNVDRRLIQHIAILANLSFSEEEVGEFTEQMNEVLRYMEILDGLDTSGIEPTFSSLEERGGVFREDRVELSIPSGEALRNAPDAGQGHFRVPKIIS